MLTESTEFRVQFVKRQKSTRRFGKRKLNGINKFLRLDCSVALNIPRNPNQPINEFIERRVPGEMVREVATNCRL